MSEAAVMLGQARLANRPVSLPGDLAPADEDQAYAVQKAMHVWFDDYGNGPLSGYKIGCTTKTMQDIVGVPSPTFGGVMAPRVHHNEATFNLSDFQQVGIECEVAVRLSSDLPASGAPYDRASVSSAIGACMAAIELVDNRYGDFLSVPAPVLIADDFFQSACVLGAEVKDWQGLDLAAAEGRTFVNGKLVGSGLGSDVLGHPLEAVVWIANRMASLGRGLKAGELILTGSLVAVQWPEQAPFEAAISIGGLGDVGVKFI